MPNPSFKEKLSLHMSRLCKREVDILQVNVGKYCNLTCSHCHVESGPTKTRENMDRRTAKAVVQFIDRSRVQTLDLTGGAPELNPCFRYLVEEACRRGKHVIDRCNLTVLLEPGQETLSKFLANHGVEVIASLPCYSKENVDEQRGKGVFTDSVKALKKLNRLGYGRQDSGLTLNLVYNPVGPHLPPPQEALEADYRVRLREDFGICFNRLYTITNMPITRYAKYLKAFKCHDAYIELLRANYNSGTLDGLMCRNTLSVGWDGRLYDCDFNQALGMAFLNGKRFTIFDVLADDIKGREILTADHCFACTAGAGSSCQGALN